MTRTRDRPVNRKRGLAGGLLAVLLIATVYAGEASVPEPTARWWATFNHPGLTAAIEQGLASHPDAASALARLQAAEIGVELTRAGRRPELGAEVGYRGGREKSVETDRVEDDIDPVFGSARLSWELDLFRRRGAEIDAASARAGQALANLEGVQLMLSLEIARAYVSLAYMNRQTALDHDQAQDARIIYDRAERRQAAGLDPAVSRDLALAAWQQAEFRLKQTEIERNRMRARYTSLVGGTPAGEEPQSLAGFTLPPVPELAGKDPVLRRPDVVKAHLAWMEAGGEAKASARARLPSLSLVVSAAGDAEDPGDPESWSAWAGPVVSLPVWKPGLKAKSRQAAARAQVAEDDLRAVSLRAVEEISQARAERAYSEEMIGHMQIRREALESVATTVSRQRAAGLIQEDALRRARLDASRAAAAELQWRAAALNAHFALIAALGGASNQ